MLVGATGLIGRSLLPRLAGSDRYGQVHVLLRRAAPSIEGTAKTICLVVDFANLPEPLPAVDDVYIALGTTIKVAGSEAAFRQVDFDFVVATARAARAAGATRIAVVSALGADTRSMVFYSRVKGEMQATVSALGYEAVVFAQPSLLIGDRAALGQPVRSGEVIATRMLGPLMWMVPKSVRPIEADDVAQAMLNAMLAGQHGVTMLSSAQMLGSA